MIPNAATAGSRMGAPAGGKWGRLVGLKRKGRPKLPLPFPLEFLRTYSPILVHTNDNDAAPLNVRTGAAPQLHPLEVDRHQSPLTF